MDNPSGASGLQTYLAHPAHVEAVVGAAAKAAGSPSYDFGAKRNDALYRVEGGAALIRVMGPLLARGGCDGSLGVTSYDFLTAALKQATDDFAVDRIVLMVDSPGGQAAGVDGVVDAVRTAATRKPTSATIEGMCYSAAYWIASQTDEIVATSLSELGSIGVVIAHVDLSRMYDAAGVKVSLIHAGAKKVDGNPYEPLSSRARDDMQERVEELRTRFAADVAQRRGIAASTVLATEAGDFLADKAVAISLVDRVASLQSVLSGPPPRSRNGGRARSGGAASASAALSLNQRGAVPWSTIADQLNAEAGWGARSGGAAATASAPLSPPAVAIESVVSSPAAASQDLSGTAQPEIAGRSNAENGFSGLSGRTSDNARANAAPWSDIADELNAKASGAVYVPRLPTPNQRGAVSWSTIADELNIEVGGLARIEPTKALKQQGSAWSAIADRLNAELAASNPRRPLMAGTARFIAADNAAS